MTEPAIRGILSGTGSLFIIIGVTIQFLLGTFLQWREVALYSIIFPVIAFLLLFFVPESPYWLLTKGKLDEAQKSLAWLRGWQKKEYVSFHTYYKFLLIKTKFLTSFFFLILNQILEEYNLLHERISNESTAKPEESNKSKPKLTWKEKVAPFRHRSFVVPFILVSITFFIGHFSGMTTLQTFAVQIFHTLKGKKLVRC